MSQQRLPLHQDQVPFWVNVQTADDFAIPTQAEEYHEQYLWSPSPQPSYHDRGVESGFGYPQYYTSFQNVDFTNATNHVPPLQAYHQPLVTPFPAPLPSSQIPTPDFYGSEPAESPSTPASSSSPVSTVSPDVCRQARPHFNEEAQRWICGGCSKTFSDRYGAERHIATVGLKVTCRYCGRRVSVLGSSRRRHFQRDTCRREGIRRGFTTRNEEDAFLE